MAQIQVLDSETIDKIAAGEVVERPASVVKELVENAIDAGATSITVEAKDGGISFLRVTDNGCGMEKEQIRKAFLRHATSKITTVDDLSRISSLGFRGEALSSIAAVSKVELITKTSDELTGVRFLLEGSVEKGFEEIGAPNGTTFIMRNLFFNTPVRRRFLKQPATEGGYIADLMEHLALSRPDISFKFQLGNQLRFHTSGNGDLREVIYRIYGREIATMLVPIEKHCDKIKVEGYLGKPVLNRSNRNFEIYFINGRFIKSNLIARAIEEGYKEYLMQHKFPFCVLHITMDTQQVDVNVHPTKMDVRFSDQMAFSELLSTAIKEVFHKVEMIPSASLSKEEQNEPKPKRREEAVPEPFESQRTAAFKVMEETKYQTEASDLQEMMQNPVWNPPKEAVEEEKQEKIARKPSNPDVPIQTAVQRNLFEEKLLSVENQSRYRMIGQVFDTYWMIEFEDKLLLIDQHAAHEKVKYESLMKQFHEKQVASQNLLPPIIVSLSAAEEQILKEYLECFLALGFEVEAFGGNEYALRSVPVDLYGCGERQLFLEVLDELSQGKIQDDYQVVEEKIASMSCKAAVKGNHSLSTREAQELIDQLLTLDNPYHCPHGRPTIITITKSEMEKKFKRIVS